MGEFLIDIDHIFDYIREVNFKNLITKPTHFFEFCEYNKFQKNILIFHSFELFALLFLGYYFLQKSDAYSYLLFGMTMHLVLDLIFNPCRFYSYSFIYRWKKDFKGVLIFDMEKIIKKK